MKGKAVSAMVLSLLLIGALSLTFDVGRATEEIHDVAVTILVASKTVVGQGYWVSINITVENQGGFAETFNVTVYYSSETLTPEQWEAFWSMGDINRDGFVDDIDVGLWEDAYGSQPGDPNWNPDADLDQDGDVDPDDFTIVSGGYGSDIWHYFDIVGGSIQRQTVNDLSPEISATLVFNWNTTGVPYGNYSISAKATRVPNETDTLDNTLTDGWVVVTIPGDVDGDGDVDPSDFATFAGAYGTAPPSSPNSDIDGDDDVDPDDFAVFSRKYGQALEQVRLRFRYPEGYDYYPWKPVGEMVWVIVDIESPEVWDDTAQGIVGWSFDVQVDPYVLEPSSAHGADFGYYLFDFCDYYGYTEHYPSLMVGEINKATGEMIDVAEFIMGFGTLGVGAGGKSGPDELYGIDYGLVRLRYISQSISWASIVITNAYYYTIDPEDPNDFVKSTFDTVETALYGEYLP